MDPFRVSSIQQPRHAGRALPSSGWLREPGLGLLLASVALVVVASLALAIGWALVLVVIAFLQVLVSRAWTDYLEVPGAVPASLGILAVAVVADAGIVVAHLVDDSDVRASELLPLAPALGVTFLTAVVVQLLRRDGRAGTLAGLVAVVTGGLIVVGLAAWLPLLGSPAAAGWVAAGFAVAGGIGIVVGARAWIAQSSAPAAALVLPVLLALLAGPFYVVGRVVAG